MKNNYENIIGYSDILTPVFQDHVNSKTISEIEAYNIKNQLKNEYNEGRVKDEVLPTRIAYLMSEKDLNSLDEFKKQITRIARFCPYCSKAMINDGEDCSFCGYHSSVEEQTRHNSPTQTVDLELENEIINMMQGMEEEIDYEYDNQYYTFDSEKIYSNPKIDLYELMFNMSRNYTFDESYDLSNIQSKLSKEELYELALNENYIEDETTITKKASLFLVKEKWISYYRIFLNAYNFDEFEEFFSSSKLNIEDASIEFITQHIEDAKKKKDFEKLIDSYTYKTQLYDNQGNYDKSLEYDMKIFILSLNPCYLNNLNLEYYNPISYTNAYSLNAFSKAYSTKYFKKLFNEEWNKIDFEKIFINKKQCWKILNKILKGDDFNKLNDSLNNKYNNNH